MSVAVSIVSTIIKSAVKGKIENELSNELLGISIDSVSETGINKINDFIINGKSKIENILSKEKMKSMDISEDNIAYIVAEIKELISGIEITDEIFRQCKYDRFNLRDFLWNEYTENKTGYIEGESDIKKSLLSISEALIKLMRESEGFVKDISIQISNTVDETRVEIQRISDYLEENVGKISADNQRILDILREMLEQNEENKGMKKSRTQEYVDKWNANMFLNNFDKRDENAGVNVELREVYLDKHLPNYIWGNNKSEHTDLKELLTEYIEKCDENKMLLILGQPGIGKSTLITWITANYNERMDDILVYQFAADLKNIDWQKPNISKEILNALNLSYSELNGKILILDGFDEISIEANRRMDILDSLYGEWIYKKNIENSISLIITCRENYIQGFEGVKCNYITLKAWSGEQIKSFCNVFQAKTKNSISIETISKLIENKEILGVPLILYMILALNISIEKEGSVVDIYDRIFSLEGGIYDRCIDYKRFADPHRISEIKRQVHQMSREIALCMFENNSEKACISQDEYRKICDYVIILEQQEKREMESDFLIGNFFKLVKHCEGIETEELYFVHRSIYEYFVAEAIFSSIEDTLIELSDKSQEKFAGNIVIYLKKGCINYFIAEYLRYKILKLYSKLNKEKQKRFYQWWENAVNKMLEYGMFYYTGKNVSCFKNIISAECQCFLNLLEILRLLLCIDKRKYIMESVKRELTEKYIKYCCIEHNIFNSDRIMDFSKMFLQKVNLKRVPLKGLCLNQVNLESTDLSNVDLSRVALIGANLAYANLRGANLEEAALMGTDLKGADLRNAQLQFAHLESTNLSRANLRGANLIKADLRKADLTDVNLTDVELEQSEWYSSDVKKIFSQLKFARFTYIIVADRKKKKLYRSELFPNINNLIDSCDSLVLNSELRKS